MNSYLRFPDNSMFLFEDMDIRESLESYMAKADVWGVSHQGKRWRTAGGIFEARGKDIVFVMDMEEKK